MNEEMEKVTDLKPVEENTEICENYEGYGIGTGLAMLIGSGLTLAAIAGGMKLKKAWKVYKSKKEQEIIDAEYSDCFEDEDVIEDDET